MEIGEAIGAATVAAVLLTVIGAFAAVLTYGGL